MYTGFDPKELASMPEPDWSSRPWGRPNVRACIADYNTNLKAEAAVTYHGLRVRGIRLFHNTDGTLSVHFPQKRFGERIESVAYIIDREQRQLLFQDVAWLFVSVFSRRLNPMEPVNGQTA